MVSGRSRVPWPPTSRIASSGTSRSANVRHGPRGATVRRRAGRKRDAPRPDAAQVNFPATRRPPRRASEAPAVGVVDQRAQRGGDAVGVGLGVGDRVAAHLGQRRAVGGQHRRAARHRLQHRQPEPLAAARQRHDERAAEEAGQVGPAQVAGAQHAQAAAGTVGQRRVDLVVPAAAAREHQRGRRRRRSPHGLDPAADQVGHVLARLERAEEGDVRGGRAGRAGPDTPLVSSLAGPVEDRRGRRRGRRRRCASGRRSSSRTSSSRVALEGTISRAARRTAVRVADLK